MIRLRREHRIVGHLIGCPPKTPHQQVDCGLPLVLSSEEVAILASEDVIQTVFYSNKRVSSSDTRFVFTSGSRRIKSEKLILGILQ